MPTSAVSDHHRHIFRETELRLGQPGCADVEALRNCSGGGGKRGFAETIVDLKLNLSSQEKGVELEKMKPNNTGASSTSTKPSFKAQFVGWPPVKSFRKNSVVAVQKNENDHRKMGSNNEAAFVKVSMDGAPYLRKVDLKIYKSYDELSDALAKMFGSFSIGKCGSKNGLKDFMNGSDSCVVTYEDKDGDWMLVGDLPWEMFVDSCKSLRIMKRSEAIGLAPGSVC